MAYQYKKYGNSISIPIGTALGTTLDGWVTVATGGDVVIDGNWRFGGSSNEATWGTFEPHKTLIQELQSETDKWLSGVEI